MISAAPRGARDPPVIHANHREEFSSSSSSLLLLFLFLLFRLCFLFDFCFVVSSLDWSGPVNSSMYWDILSCVDEFDNEFECKCDDVEKSGC